ncbi:MAG: ATP synthase F1 subunit delta [Candidatus Magasanikbacteria bacterium]|nr:ATP synthase F1 subunit delta [Candidatus Magasanikbacteria bacterium]NLZ97022.1 ATP synthase F1 subunit delta [Candidatus Magasanikbacteria bacterium]
MKKSNKQFAEALYKVTKSLKDKDLERVLFNFAKLLVRSHKLKQAERIIEEYIKYAKKQEGVKEIEITSAHKLDQETIDKIKQVFGDKVNEQQIIDKNILGGVSIKLEDKILDATIKTQLKQLKNAL